MNIILSLLGVTDAYAAATGGAPAAGQGSSWMSVLPMFVVLGLFMYLMIIRPQSKRAKEHKNFVSTMKKGDEVVTAGGILGKIESIAEDFVVLSISENVNVNVQKNSIINCVPKGTMKDVSAAG